MREEVYAAVGFLAKFMQSKLSKDSVEKFKHTLQTTLQRHYSNHWFPDMPHRGSGYRCIRINSQVMDPLLSKAAKKSGIDINSLRLFPDELTMWVDPYDVSYRIGENGSIGQLDLADNTVQQHSDIVQQPIIDSISPYPMKTHSSCKDHMRDFTSPKYSYPLVYAAFAS